MIIIMKVMKNNNEMKIINVIILMKMKEIWK